MRGEIKKRGRAERAVLDHLRNALQFRDTLATKAGIIAGSSLKRCHHRMSGRRKAASEPQTRERAAAGEKNSHVNPRSNSVPWNEGSKSGQSRSFGGDVDRRSRPDDAETGIVKANPAFLLRGVECVCQVECFGVVCQRDEAVSEALRRVHHQAVICGEFGAEPLGEGWANPAAGR